MATQLLCMVRNGKAADVHPAMVAAYAAHGWTPAEACAVGGGEAPVLELEPVVEAAPEPERAQASEPPLELEPVVEAVEADGGRWSVHRLQRNGTPRKRASRADLSRAQAEAYCAERADAEFQILPFEP